MRKGLSVIVCIAILLFAYSASAGVVTNNLVSWWTFDNATNEIAYDTAPAGNNNTGTITDATWTNVTAGSASSGALYFNGSSAYIGCGMDSSLRPTNAITIEMWAKPNVDNATQTLCDNGNNAVNCWGASLDLRDNGKYRATLGNGSYRQTVNSATSYTTNEWQHFVVTWDGDGDAKIRLYRNTTLDTSTDSAWFAKPLTYHTGIEMTIGAAQWGGYYFNGIIDEVRIYDKALNQTEITQNYNAIPEPATLLLLGGGLLSLLAFRRRGRR